jgi:hypothetical protein
MFPERHQLLFLNLLWSESVGLYRFEDARCGNSKHLQAFALVVGGKIGRYDDQVYITSILCSLGDLRAL